MNTFSKKIFYTLGLTAITVLFVLFIRANSEYLKKIAEITPGMLLTLIGLSLMSRLIAGLKIRTVTEVFGVKLKFKEWYGTASIMNFYNYFLSKSGTALAGAYLKKNHGFNYSKYLSLIMGDIMVIFIASGIMGFTAYIYGLLVGMFENWLLAVFFLCLALVMISMVFIPEVKLPDKGIFTKVNKVIEGWNTIRRNRALMGKMFLLNIGLMVAGALRYYILFRLFADKVPLFICLLIAPLNSMAQIVSFIPAAYGIREGITGIVTKLANFGFVPGAMVALVDRVIMMSVAFVQGPIFSFLFIKQSGIKPEEEIL